MPTTREEPPPNRRLGDFELVREVGRGGMGIVYEARQVSLNRKVALKVLAAGLALTDKAVQRFHREAEAAAKLHHSNIVPVYATGEQDGIHFYAMELIEGPSLDRVLDRLRRPADPAPPELLATGPYVPGDAASQQTGLSDSSLSSGGGYFDSVAKMVADVADALDHAHKNGVIHRDIKPSNLLLSPDGRLSVNDFGLARVLEQPGMTMTGEFMGTPAYMSPEQITAGRTPLDHRTDIYSLGATLYELLTLRPPFTGERRDQVLAQIIHKEPIPPRKLNKKVPVDLETICLKALDKDPDRRYQTAGQMADDLRRFLNRYAIRARRPGPVELLQKWVKRNPALAAAAAVALLAACAAGYFAWQTWKGKVDNALEKAVTAALNGQNEEADRHITAAEKLWAPLGEVAKVRGIIALHGNNPEAAIAQLKIAEDELGPTLAVKALLSLAYKEVGNISQAQQLAAEVGSLVPQTAEDFLFKGQIISLDDDPQKALRLIEQAIADRPSPLAYLARAQARVVRAFDTGSEKDAVAAVDDAEFARRQLPNNDLALAACIHARLCLWDIYTDRAGADDQQRAKEQWDVAGALVADAGLRGTNMLELGCQYYHDRRGKGLWYAEKLWTTTHDLAAGESYACELFRAGNQIAIRKVLDETRQRRGSRGDIEWFVWACLQAEDGRAEDVFKEGQKELDEPPGPAFVLIFPAIALLLKKPEEAQRLYADALERGRVVPWHNGWYKELASYGASDGRQAAENKLLNRAGESRLHQCEAHFHIALHHLGHGNKKLAQDHLKKTVETRVFTYLEHQVAGIFLARMKDPEWPRWIKERGGDD